jgi:hypothetical protein
MKIGLAAGLVVALAGSLSAGPLENSVADQLRQQGYEQITVSRTLLGRARVVGQSKNEIREIVINPRTGEILRDFRQPTGAGAGLLGGGGYVAIGGGNTPGASGGTEGDDDDGGSDDGDSGEDGDSDGGDDD